MSERSQDGVIGGRSSGLRGPASVRHRVVFEYQGLDQHIFRYMDRLPCIIPRENPGNVEVTVRFSDYQPPFLQPVIVSVFMRNYGTIAS